MVLDVNWRPVFWDDEATAKATVLEYIKQAHILKVTDEVGRAIKWVCLCNAICCFRAERGMLANRSSACAAG